MYGAKQHFQYYLPEKKMVDGQRDFFATQTVHYIKREYDTLECIDTQTAYVTLLAIILKGRLACINSDEIM